MSESFEKTLLAASLSALLIGSIFVSAFTMSDFAYAQVADDPTASDAGTSDPGSSDTSSSNSTSSESSTSSSSSSEPESSSSENANATDTSSNSTDTAGSDTSASNDSNATSSETHDSVVSGSNSTSDIASGNNSTSSQNEATSSEDSSGNTTSAEPIPPSLTSDKAEYSPGEVAHVRGSNFEPETSYDLYVFRGDGWIVKSNGEEGFETIITDVDGNFDYSYQLPSVNGEWMILIYESSDTELNNLVSRLKFDVSAPTLSTDKFDYDPSETVIVSGKGFRSGESYDIVIERPDGSILKGDGTTTAGFDSVTANLQGRFAYEYILNGIPGNYMIYVYRSSDALHEELIARGGFNDANSGPKFPGSATSSTWTAPVSNSLASDNVCTTSSGSSGSFIEISNFGFTASDIPAGAIITAVQVEVDGARTGPNGNTAIQLITSPGTLVGSSQTFTLTGACSSSTFASITAPGTPTWGATLSQAQVTSSGFGVRITQPTSAGTRSVDSLRITITFETSISWEKRLEATGSLNGPATFEVSPDPSDGIGTMTVVDNGANDVDMDLGQLKVNNVAFGIYAITETTPTSGTALDDDATRTITVSTSELNPVVGTQGVDDAGNSEESDFHNRLGSIEWEKRLETGSAPYPLQGGATFTVSPDPSDGVDTMTVVDNGANDADPDAGQIKVINARLAAYTITETVAPSGSTIDNDATRAVTVSAADLSAVVGSSLGSPPGTDDAGDTDESDFHNVPVTVSVTFNASPAMADVSGTTAVLTVTIGGGSPTTVLKSELPRTFTGVASGTTVSYSYGSPLASTAAGKQHRWSSMSGTGSATGVSGQTDSFTITSTSSVTATYLTQYQVTFFQTGLNGLDATGTVVTVSGSPKTVGDLPFSTGFVDSGTAVTFDYNDPVSSSVAGKQYRLSSITGGSEPSITVTSPTTVTGNYVEQYRVTFEQSGLLADSTGIVVTVDAAAKFHTDLPFSKFVDGGVAVSFDYSEPATSSISGKQYRLVSITGGSEPSVTVSAPITITGNYIEQFGVTFEESGVDGSVTGTLVTVDSAAQTSLPYSKYVDSGSSVAYSYENIVSSSAPDKRFRLDSVTGPSSPITVTSPTTITGNYVKQFQVTFEQTGLGIDSTGTVVMVDADSKLRTDLPFSKFVDTGTAVAFDYTDPVASSISGKQYRLSSITGGSEPSVAVATGTVITGNYVEQFQITFAQTGLDGSATGTVVTVDGSGKTFAQLPFSKFVDSGSTVTFDYADPVSSSDTNRRFVLSSITGGSEPSVVVSTDLTITGNYQSQHKVTFDHTGLDSTSSGVVVNANGEDKTFADLPFTTDFINDGSTVTYLFTDPVSSTTAGKQFRLDSVSGQASGFTLVTYTTVTGNYVTQYQATFKESDLDSSANSVVVTVDAADKTFADLPFTTSFLDEDTVINYDFKNLVSSSTAGKQFRLDSVSGPLTGFSLTAPTEVTGSYVTQYLVTFDESGLDGSSVGTVVTVDSESKFRIDLPFSKYVDSGSAVSYLYENPVASITADKQFRLTGVSGPASPITVTGPVSVAGNYIAQYKVTFEQTGLDGTASGTVVTVNGSPKEFGDLPFTTGFIDEGSTVAYAYTDPVASSDTNRQFRLVSITGPSTDFALTAPTQITGNYQSQHKVTFDHTGLDGTATGVIVNANGDSKNFADLPYTTDFIDDGATITYSFTDPATSSTPGKQFRLDSVSGPASGFILSTDVTVTGNYVKQYQVTFGQTGLDASATTVVVTVGSADKSFGDLPFTTAFLDENTVIDYDYKTVVSSSTPGKQFRLDSVSGPLTGFALTAPADISGGYVTQYLITFDQSGLDLSSTGTVVTVDGDAKTAADLAFSKYVDSGSSVTYLYENPAASTTVDKRFRLTGVTGPSSPFSVLGPESVTGNYIIQYSVTFTHTGLDGTATSTVFTINASPKSFGDLPYTDWFDIGSTYSYSSPVGSSSPGSSFLLQGITGQASPISTSGTVTGDYFKTIVISGMKFEDQNGDGDKAGDSGLESWVIFIDSDGSGTLDAGEVSTITASDGTYSLTNLGPGTYKIREQLQAGWVQTTADPADIVASSGVNVDNIDFGNFELFDITGYKYDDINGDGNLADGAGLEGWTINLVKDGSAFASTITAIDGSYSFTDLGPGEYTVSEGLEPGWMQTYPASPGTYTFNGASSTNVLNQDFGNFKLITISGLKFEDHDGDGSQAVGDQGLESWTVTLDKDSDGSIEQSTLTASDGTYSFSDLGPGTYRIREVQQTGWTQTTADPFDIAAESGTDVGGANFGNFQLFDMTGSKFEDHNGDGVEDSGDQGLQGWTINLEKDGLPFASTTTDANGDYFFADLGPGEYTIVEIMEPGWTQTFPSSSSYDVTGSSGIDVSDKDFGNFKNFKISGMKFEDHDGDGTQDIGDQGLQGWSIFLDSNANGVKEPSEPSTLTDSNGNYEFADLGPGSYTAREELMTGWTKTTSNPAAVAGSSGVDVPGINFGNFENFAISGNKFDDMDGNGQRDLGETTGVSGVTIQLDKGADDTVDATTTTDSNGDYSFEDLGPGTYRIREVAPSGWVQTTTDPADVAGSSGVDSNGNDFGNFELISISGKKFNDLDGDGSDDSGTDPGLAGWIIFIDSNNDGALTAGETSASTAADGSYSFIGLGPGVYKIREVLQSGWTMTTANPADIVAQSGSDVIAVNFGNFQLVTLSGKKFHDLDGDKTDDVGTDPRLSGWTIQLRNSLNMVIATTTTDSDGNYQFTSVGPGSYTINEVLQSGWHQTLPVKYPVSPGSYPVTTSSGINVGGKDFGNIKARTVTGFYQPIDMNSVVNVIKNGQAVPAKFEIFVDGIEQTATSEIVGGTLSYKKISCSTLTGEPTDEIEITNTGATTLRYDSTGGQYIQNWKTPTGAGYCYSLTATIIDGTTIVAYFRTK